MQSNKGKLCCGETDPIYWDNYGAPGNTWGLKVTVDMTGCGFKSTPIIMTSLSCKDTSCEYVNGGGAFDDIGRTGFVAKVSRRLATEHAPSACGLHGRPQSVRLAP